MSLGRDVHFDVGMAAGFNTYCILIMNSVDRVVSVSPGASVFTANDRGDAL